MAALLLLFWVGYGVLWLPPVRWARLLQQQRSLGYYSREWEAAEVWVHGPQAARLLLDRGVMDSRVRALQQREAYLETDEWLLIYLGYRLQGLNHQQISELPNGGLILAGALAGEASPPPWAAALAAPLSPHPHSTFGLGLLSAKDFRLVRQDSPQIQDLRLYCLLVHELDWPEAERVQLLSQRRAGLQGHNALCLQAALEMRSHLLKRLAPQYPPGSRLRLQVTPPRRVGGRLALHLKLLLADTFRSLGYRVELGNPTRESLPLPLTLELRLSNFEQLGIQERRSETSTSRRAVTRFRYSKYGGSSSIDYQNQSETRIVVEEKIRAASVPTLWVRMLGQEFALPPFGELDSGDLERIQRLYAAPKVAPEEWFYWDYNFRVRASAPWRYGLEDFRRLTY